MKIEESFIFCKYYYKSKNMQFRFNNLFKKKYSL